MDEKFELALVLGRYQHLHTGHQMIIEMARKISKKTLVLIGSSEKSGTVRNPYTIQTRRKIIEKVYGNEKDVIIAELKDLSDENNISFEWGRYLLDNVQKIVGRKPDLMIYGKDESRKGWFDENEIKDITELIVSRNKINISATKLREYLVNNDYDNWSKFVPKEIYNDYEELRNELIEKFNKII